MSEKLIRTFLSIPVPKEVRSKKNMLYSTLEDSPAKINWVKNIQLHLTIKFLSHTPESVIEKIIDRVESITSGFKPFDIFIESTGCFPVKERPRLLWMGVNGNLDPLYDLFIKVEDALDILGFLRSSRITSPYYFGSN